MNVASKIYRNDGNPSVLSLVPLAARTVLDVGCGAGDNAAILASRGVAVDGITISVAEAETSATACRRVIVHDLERGLPLGLAESYDCCLCSHVLEHICWPEQLLYDILRVLLPSNAPLIVALPNFLFVKERLRLLHGDFHYEPSGLWDETHFRWYTYSGGRKLLETHGFDVLHSSASGVCPLRPIRRLAPRLAKKFDAVVCRLWPGLFGLQFIYVARPKMNFSRNDDRACAFR
jgi:SAM-dependent methyltransferase